MITLRKESNVKPLQSDLGRMIEQFLAELKKKSKRTEISYRGDINRFLKTVFQKTISTITFMEIEKTDFDLLTDYFNNEFEGMSNNTKNRHLRSIKSLMRHLKARNQELDISYLDLISSFTNDAQRIERMPREVVFEYIEEAGKERFNGKAKQLLIMLAVDTALRIEDYLEMEWNQFSPQEDGVVLTGYGKGGKRWIEKISFNVYDEVLKLKEEQEEGEKRVFSPLSEKNVYDMMTRIKKNLGYDDRRYSFHSLKKTGVTFAYRLTGDILEAKKKGKHSNLETTQIYLEEVDYGITGMFSLGENDNDLYTKVSHEELLKALEGMNKDMLFLLNVKLQESGKA